MDKTERKERLKDIIDVATDTIKSLESKKTWLNKAVSKIEELDDLFGEEGEPAEWDKEQLIISTVNSIFEKELEEVYELTDDFNSDIEAYIEELSEVRAERLSEKFELLEDVLQKFSQSNQEYDDIDTAIKHLEEAIADLREMRK